MALFELDAGVHRKFYRIERDGRRVELHWGRIGTAGQRKTIELDDEAAAEAEYQAQIERRRERGYVAVADETAAHGPEPEKVPRRGKKELGTNGALEALVVADPDDEAAWQVLEDWLLAEGDPRAPVVEAARARDPGEAAMARGRIDKLLWGPRSATILKALDSVRWRAGYLLECGFTPPERNPREVAAAWAAAPATRLLSQLRLSGDDDAMVDLIGAAHFAPALRFLQLAMQARAICAEPLASLVNLRRLVVVVQVEGELSALAAAPPPRLVELEVRTGHDRAPALLTRLVGTPLLAGLRLVIAGGRELSREQIAVLGAPFAHLDSLVLPAALLG